MTIDQESLPQTEIVKGKARLSPVQGVMSQARREILTHESDFTKAGASRDLVEKAAELAAERAKSEFEQKVNDDPLCKVATVLRELGRTDDEKEIVEKGCRSLETFRFGWQQSIKAHRDSAEINGQFLSVEEIVKELTEISCAPSLVQTLTSPDGQETYHLCFRLIQCDPLVTYQAGEPQVEKGFSYLEEVLVALGALQNGEDISSLKSLPSGEEDDKGPLHFKKSWTEREFARVATNIDGVLLDVNLNYPSIHMLINLDVLEKIVDFPSSGF